MDDGAVMLELYEKKFILAMDDGGLVACYWDIDEAIEDGKHIAAEHPSETYRVFELTGRQQGKEELTCTYALRETIRAGTDR